MLPLDRDAAYDAIMAVAVKRRRERRARKVVEKLMMKQNVTVRHKVVIKRIADIFQLDPETIRRIVRETQRGR